MGQRTVVCPNCKRPVKPVECSRRNQTRRYVVITYCCPKCGTELLTERMEVHT
jgi:RNase P subunit RPR2